MAQTKPNFPSTTMPSIIYRPFCWPHQLSHHPPLVAPPIAHAVSCVPCCLHHVMPLITHAMVTPLITYTMCCAPHHPCHGHAPHCLCCQLCPSSHAPCIAPVACAVVMHIIACTLHRLRCVSHHLLPMSCVTPIAHAMVVHLVVRTMCCTPCHAHCPCCG